MNRDPPRSTLFPYTPPFRSPDGGPDRPPAPAAGRIGPPPSDIRSPRCDPRHSPPRQGPDETAGYVEGRNAAVEYRWRSEEHTAELQSRSDLVCRLLAVTNK